MEPGRTGDGALARARAENQYDPAEMISVITDQKPAFRTVLPAKLASRGVRRGRSLGLDGLRKRAIDCYQDALERCYIATSIECRYR